VSKPPQQRSSGKTYSVTAKLGHDGLHGLLILLEQYTQLFVLLLEGMVLDDNLGVGTLELRLERFCKERISSRQKLRPHVTVRTLGNVHIESSQRRFRLQVARFSLEVAMTPQRTKLETRAMCVSAP
jgi:hypothetical protein